MIVVAGLLFAVTIAQDATLRPSCDGSDAAAGKIPAGTQVEIRFAVSDGSNCYKIAATVDGKPVLGYVDGSALADTKSFDEQRRGGASLDGIGQSQALAKHLNERAGDPVPERAGDPVPLLNTHQPAKALEQIEQMLKNSPRDAKLLALASVAAYRSDDLRRAAGYCRDALALTDDSQTAGFCRTVERESREDKSGEKLVGMRVALRYEGQTLPADMARSMVAILDEEFGRISEQLGCVAEERITAIVQSRDAYLKTTNAAEWSGGQYDGRIHVSMSEGRWDGKQLDAGTRRTLAHEMVHACLANIGRFPSWLHEGLAQKLSGDTLSASVRADLRDKIRGGAIPKLENMGQNWSRLNAQNARLAYNLALAAADALVEDYANAGLRNMLRNPEMLTSATAGVDRALGFY
jgi:hypothetical protein